MSNTRKFYINGEWVEPIGSDTVDVINPATEDAIGTIAPVSYTHIRAHET